MNLSPKTIHAFEEAGLGVAPFHFLEAEDTSEGANENGMVSRFVKGVGTIMSKPGGSCAFCGTYIVVFCKIQDSHGKRFHVGTSCVKKTGDKGLINTAIRAAGRISRAKAKVKQEVRITTALVALTGKDTSPQDLRLGEFSKNSPLWSSLSALPHPESWLAKGGATRADWARWMYANAGHAGKFKVTKWIEKFQMRAS